MSTKETGLTVVLVGVTILTMGFVLLMDTVLMAAGNLLILGGGIYAFHSHALSFFERDKILGTAIFLLGGFLLFFRYAMLGFVLEIVGVIYILKSLIPNIKNKVAGMLFSLWK